MGPLNECLQHYLDRHHNDSDVDAPTWLTFHDEDEYLYPVDTDHTIDQALDVYNTTCCMTVRRASWATLMRSGGRDVIRPTGFGGLQVFLPLNRTKDTPQITGIRRVFKLWTRSNLYVPSW